MRTGRNGDGRAGLPVARGDADRPTIAGRAWAGTDLDVATSEAEHAHAGGVLSPRAIVTPTGPAEGENDRWIFNPGPIVDNSEKRSLIGRSARRRVGKEWVSTSRFRRYAGN